MFIGFVHGQCLNHLLASRLKEQEIEEDEVINKEVIKE
jgi:hypothetical protein